jgi:hypothetical protein
MKVGWRSMRIIIAAHEHVHLPLCACRVARTTSRLLLILHSIHLDVGVRRHTDNRPDVAHIHRRTTLTMHFVTHHAPTQAERHIPKCRAAVHIRNPLSKKGGR